MPHSCADATCSTEQYWKGEEVSWNKEKGVNLATCVADSSWRILSRQKQSSSSDTHSMKSKPWMFTTLRSGGRGNCNKYCLQSRGWWCGTDRARVTSRLFSGPCKQSRPMTCSIMPFEEEASSVTTKKNQGVPLLTIGSSSWLQRGACLPFSFAAEALIVLTTSQPTEQEKPTLGACSYPQCERKNFR
ncbi:uncharacterized protein LOC121079132 isoform X4 [Cygnus olor]|uniref:uncharacterized protein LOC118247810 isoform X11 n=2 Tax=Cygnus atratus TaxID=8868 RepID=UPI0015D617D5|nr:uncharacterized protein LOC118247810 isoform X11 [Cygnus atratus]XP_035401999.1 uncharacterized protein LOC118247810 isoform X11 [Cygnus atratus]XP_035402000.1 uncharacterized protein LOC118247810 isoform X11 [Cygnus atratus]XP_040431992.1 uncharacterized protein LOC121079132 isoform X4 [Cygnus olor]XP_040432000.1 uncharacterized protein LOC121079132 isoform X4 [Cygnus olor]XP_040432010.1 uncharacterized protein LOC121079132 isoform X4 [Cygnus olor]XP_050564055.1 uncharacterized protein LO